MTDLFFAEIKAPRERAPAKPTWPPMSRDLDAARTMKRVLLLMRADGAPEPVIGFWSAQSHTWATREGFTGDDDIVGWWPLPPIPEDAP